MSWTIEYWEADRVVQIKTSGPQTSKEMDQLTLAAVSEAKKHGANCYLYDDRDGDPEFTTLQIYRQPKRLLDLGVTKESRVAAVISKATTKMDDWKFFQDRIVTFGGIDIRIFVDSVEDAVKWLSGNQASPS